MVMFTRWGIPGAIKVDNGEPFGDPMRKSIPTLALWLICLDIVVIWNRPNQPTDNAIVERMQGTSRRWAEVDRCTDYRELMHRLDDVALVQREQYNVSRLGYKTRLQSYPELEEVIPVNSYEQFNAQRAYKFLSKTRLVRRVGKNGRLSLNGYKYYVGREYYREEIGVGFDPGKCTWLFYDQLDQLIAQAAADTLTPAHIWSIAVTRAEAS